MTLPDFDDEDNLIETHGTNGLKQANIRIPGGTMTIVILVLTATASFGLGMLAEHGLNNQSTGLTAGSMPQNGVSSAPNVLGNSIASTTGGGKFYLPQSQ